MTGNTLVDILAGWFFVGIPVALVLGPILRANRRATSVAHDRRGAAAVGDTARPDLHPSRRSGPASNHTK